MPATTPFQNPIDLGEQVRKYRQSSSFFFGGCSGYSSVWALSDCFESYNDIGSDARTEHELPATDDVIHFQNNQVVSSHAEVDSECYFGSRGLEVLLESIKHDVTQNNKRILLTIHYPIGGHKVAVKQGPDRQIYFFDSNHGTSRFPIWNTFQDFLPKYIAITQEKMNYAYSKETILPIQPTSFYEIKLREIKNVLATTKKVIFLLMNFSLALPKLRARIAFLAELIWIKTKPIIQEALFSSRESIDKEKPLLGTHAQLATQGLRPTTASTSATSPLPAPRSTQIAEDISSQLSLAPSPPNSTQSTSSCYNFSRA